MPLKLEIIRATEFIRVGAQGHFDLAASRAALATVAAACRKRGIQHAIVDLRALEPGPKPVFSPADLVELVNTFPEVGFTKRLRLAILYRSDPHKRARLFAFLSTLRGWSVRAFGDFEQALRWLSEGQEPGPQRKRLSGEKEIPIRFRKQVAPPAAEPGAVLRRRDRTGGGHRRTLSPRGRAGCASRPTSQVAPRHS